MVEYWRARVTSVHGPVVNLLCPHDERLRVMSIAYAWEGREPCEWRVLVGGDVKRSATHCSLPGEGASRSILLIILLIISPAHLDRYLIGVTLPYHPLHYGIISVPLTCSDIPQQSRTTGILQEPSQWNSGRPEWLVLWLLPVWSVSHAAVTLPTLRLLTSRAQGCKDSWKPSKPCHVGTH